MYYRVLKKDKIIYCLNKYTFDIIKITTEKEIDDETESRILTYLNKDTNNREYRILDSSFFDDFELSIGLFDTCNLNCDYCYGQKKSDSKLQLEKIEKTLFSIKKNCKVQFVGAGEALLDFKYLKDAIDVVKRYTKNVWLVTNGTLLTDDVIKYLLFENINITISMDGGNKNYQDKYRKFKNRNGTYEIILNNLKKLQEQEKVYNKKITKWISAVITNNNIDLIFLYNSFEEIPADFIMYRFYMGNKKEFCLNENPKLEINIYEYIHFIFQKIRIHDKNVYRVINQRDNVFKYLIRLVNKDVSIERCGAGITKASLYTDGNLYLCDYCSGIKNLAFSLFEPQKKKDDNCLNCNYLTLCGGYCKYENYLKNNFSCIVTPIIINNLVLELAELQIKEPIVYESLKKYCKRTALYL